jgi:hypothetical protein
MDHPERPPLYLVRFGIDNKETGQNKKHNILAEVFEDWILKED